MITPNPVWRLRIPRGDLIPLSRADECEVFAEFIYATGFDHVNIQLPEDIKIAKNVLFAFTLRKKTPVIQRATKRVQSFLKAIKRNAAVS